MIKTNICNMWAINSKNENEDENEDGAIIYDEGEELVDLLYFNLFCYIASVYAHMGLNDDA